MTGDVRIVSPLIISPLIILSLCATAAVGTILLLPSHREMAWRRIGAIIVGLAGLIFAALIIRITAGQAKQGVGAYFWIFSAIALSAAVRVVTHPRPVYSALYFVLTVFASAGLFVLMSAEFMAAALVLIYAGAILVTYVFVIMLASEAAPNASTGSLGGLAEHDGTSREPIVASAIGFALMGVLLFVVFDKATELRTSPSLAVAESTSAQQVVQGNEFFTPNPYPDATPVAVKDASLSGGTQQLGAYLFSSQIINLELAGLILALGMVGAIVISRRRVISKDEAWEPESETVVGPATPMDDNPHSIPVYGTDNPRQKAYPET